MGVVVQGCGVWWLGFVHNGVAVVVVGVVVVHECSLILVAGVVVVRDGGCRCGCDTWWERLGLQRWL